MKEITSHTRQNNKVKCIKVPGCWSPLINQTTVSLERTPKETDTHRLNGGVTSSLQGDLEVCQVTEQALPYQQEDRIDDPALITEEEAKLFLKYYGLRELFFGDVPHERALMMDQQIRRQNGLEGVRLGSNRPESPFYRWKRANGIQRHRRQ
uniref:(California timema) hypothetical protein n=1 Tax=Timema californicum TaxID=61474 RepID=A0A7R9JAZ2_TIMCA|nr:unnamed protein product [Timema californicum]